MSTTILVPKPIFQMGLGTRIEHDKKGRVAHKIYTFEKIVNIRIVVQADAFWLHISCEPDDRCISVNVLFIQSTITHLLIKLL